MRTNKGFSLVELMIVVAIIGILAAIAIPNFISMQLKAKRGEIPGNVDGIKTSELAYDAAFDGYVTATVQPRGNGSLNKTAITWVSNAAWSALNWAPDGLVRGNYMTASDATNFTVTGVSDVDDDGNNATYTATKDQNATLPTADLNKY